MFFQNFTCGPLATNAYLIACGQTKKAAIIDAPLGSSELFNAAIKKLQLDLQMILLTHSHLDHIADVAVLSKKFKAPVRIHFEDAENLKRPGTDQIPLFFPVEGIIPDGHLSDGEVLKLGELGLLVLHTPGHSPGGVCFYLKKEKVLFSGDTLFQGTIGNLSFPTANPKLMWQSLKKLAQLPADTCVYPGHGDPTTIGEEDWLEEAEEKFRRYL